MFWLQRHYAKRRMTAYIHRELSPESRRRMARLVDTSTTNYQVYLTEKHTAQELERDLPVVGRPALTALNHIWQGVQSELTAPPTVQPATPIPNAWMLIAVAVLCALPMLWYASKLHVTLPDTFPQIILETAIPPVQYATPAQQATIIAQVDLTETSREHATEILNNTPFMGTPKPNQPIGDK